MKAPSCGQNLVLINPVEVRKLQNKTIQLGNRNIQLLVSKTPQKRFKSKTASINDMLYVNIDNFNQVIFMTYPLNSIPKSLHFDFMARYPIIVY